MDTSKLHQIANQYSDSGRTKDEFISDLTGALDSLRAPDGGEPMANRDQIARTIQSVASDTFETFSTPSPEPVQVSGQVDDTYFDSDLQVDDTYFDTDVMDFRLPPSNASELSFGATLMLGMRSEGQDGDYQMPDIPPMQVMEDNFRLYGADATVQEELSTLRQELRGDMQAALPNLAADMPLEGVTELVDAYQEADTAIDLVPDRALMNSVLASDVSERPSLFSDILGENVIHTTLVDILQDAQDDIELVSFGSDDQNIFERYFEYAKSTTKLVKDAADLLFASPITERQFQTRVMQELGIDDSGNPIRFRTKSVDSITNWLLEGSNEEVQQKMLDFVEVVKEVEGGLGSNNFYGMFLMDHIQNNIQTLTGGTAMSALDDVADVFAVGDLVLMARLLGTRFVGRVSAKSKGLDAQGYEELEHEVRTFAERVSGIPNVNARLHSELLTTIPVRGSKGSLADNLYQNNPELFKRILDNADPEERIRTLQAMGLPEDDVLVRTYGTPSAEVSGIHPSAVTGQTPNLPYSSIRQVMFTDEAQQNAVQRHIQPIVSYSDGVLHPQSTTVLQSAEETDSVVFRTVFGQDADTGYDSLNAAENAKMFLMGERGEVIQRGNEFFIQADMRAPLLARDASPFEQGDVALRGAITEYLVPWQARIQKDIFNATSGVADMSTQQATEFRKLVGSIRFLDVKKGEDSQFYYLLNYGDMNETTLARSQANDLLGGEMSDTVWEAYRDTRKAYDILHQHRNATEYRRLAEDDMRSINTSGSRGAFTDEDGAVFAQPLNPERGARLFDEVAQGLDEIPVMHNDGVVRNMRRDQVQELYDNGGSLARPNRTMKMDNGTSEYDVLAIRSPDDIQPLTPTPLNKRPGHIDRRYVDPGYILKVNTSVTRNGRLTQVPKTRAVVQDKNQAEAFIARQDNPEDWSYEASREIRASLGDELTDAEIDRLQSTLYPPSSRGRGNHLLGANETPAQLLAPDEVLNQHANEIRNMFGKDAIETLKQKWVKAYSPKGNYPRDPKGYPSEAVEMHRFITNQENALTGKINASYMDGMRRLTRELIDSPEGWKQATGRALQELDRNYVAAAAKLNTYLFILGRIGYQVSANLFQQFYLLAQDPTMFARTVPRSYALMAGMMIDRTDTAGKNLMMGMLGRTFGTDAEGFSRIVRQMHESGSTNVGMADDFLHLMTGATKIQAGASTRQAAANAPMMPFKGAYALSIKMTNIANYAHAVGLYMRKNPGASIHSTKAKTEIASEARKLGFTQNRADQFAYQQNSMIVPLQFLQHVHKMFYNTTADPLFKMVTGRNIGQQGVNVFAESRAKAATTFLMAASAFGISSYIPEDATDPMRTAIRDIQALPPEVQTVIFDGWFNLISEKMYGEHFNWGDRFSGNSFVRSFVEMHADSNILDLAVGPTGASFAYMREVLDFTTKFKDTPVIDENRYREITGPMIEMFAGARDLNKARIVANHGAYVTRNGFQSAEVNPSSALLVGLSLTPTKASTYWGSSEGSVSDPTEPQELANHARRWFLRELNALGGDATAEDILDLQSKAIDALYIATNQGEGGTPIFFQEARDHFRNGLLTPENREEGVESQFIQQYGNRLMRSARSFKDGMRNIDRAIEQYPEYEEMLTFLKGYFEESYNNMEEGL